MVDYQISTYEESVKVIKEVGLLPLSPLIPQYPSLDRITSKEQWHTGSENDPWLWRAQFPVDGVAAYGKFIKKKSVLISGEILPLVKTILGSKESVSKRYKDGLISREALELYTLISEEEGIDTRVLRAKAGMKDKEKKKPFDQALLELQGSMDIVVSGTKEKINASGEKNGWSSTSFETLDYWSKNNVVDLYGIEMEEAKDKLKNHFVKIGSPESLKALGKIFQF
ncbi:AlkZ-related protein [Neobacillus drentensis]|uniref:AlkZ-related protein n=1 Tax=Neobacillus drentensis TaxID=220684 RepID=UPI00300396D4